jgi:hypothetical protein
MCIGAPKPPKLDPNDPRYAIPIRQPVLLPDNGDASIAGAIRNPRRLTTSAMILTGKGGLGNPTTTAPLGNPRG